MGQLYTIKVFSVLYIKVKFAVYTDTVKYA